MHAYTSAESSALDAAAQNQGVTGFELMRRAGVVAFERLSERYPDADTLLILAGKGNNGGDAWIVAGAALAAGWSVSLWQIGVSPNEVALEGGAARAREWALQRGVVPQPHAATPNFPTSSECVRARTLIVDGLLGTGLRAAPRPETLAAIEWANATGLPIVALDLPSGLAADSGAVPGGWPNAVIRADMTVTFIGMKLGLLTGQGPDCAGAVTADALGVNVPRLRQTLERELSVPFGTRVLDQPYVALPVRNRAAYKNQFGHLLVLAGDHGGGGAALLAAEAALRSGVGLVSVGTRGEHAAAMLARRPELMVQNVEGKLAAADLAARATTIVVGPGLGQSAWGQQLFAAAVEAANEGAKLVIDADGLNMLAAGLGPLLKSEAEVVITPHSGEAARLLGCTNTEIEADRIAAVTELARRYSCVAVLKGAGTLIADSAAVGSGLVSVCALGNPGMAVAGMGDTLAGIVGSLVAQQACTAQWVEQAVQLHAAAGDRVAAQLGEASLLAADVIDQIPAVLQSAGSEETHELNHPVRRSND